MGIPFLLVQLIHSLAYSMLAVIVLGYLMVIAIFVYIAATGHLILAVCLLFSVHILGTLLFWRDFIEDLTLPFRRKWKRKNGRDSGVNHEGKRENAKP